MTAQAAAAFVMLFVTIGPVELAPVFAGLAGHKSAAARRKIALKAILVGGGVLLAFAAGGNGLLQLLGIGFPAFRIAGGILLLLLAIDLLLAHKFGLGDITKEEEREAEHEANIAVFPLAIPLIAGPGAMTAVVLLMDRAGGALGAQALVIGMLVAVLAAGYVAMLAAGTLSRLLGVTGINVLTRISGLLLAALAVQFVLDGIASSGLVRMS